MDIKAFRGDLYMIDSSIRHGEVFGRYWLLDRGLRTERVAGEFHVRRGADSDPFYFYDTGSLRGRRARIEMDGVGQSPIRLYSDGSISDDGWTLVRFEGWHPPLPVVERAELAEVLRVAIADILEESGNPNLAALARTAAVALVGFPRDREPLSLSGSEPV